MFRNPLAHRFAQILALSACLSLFSIPALALESTDLQATDSKGVPTFIAGNLGQLSSDLAMADAATAFLDSFADERFDATGGEDFVVQRLTRDDLGFAHIQFRQLIDQREVLGAELIVHVDVETLQVEAVNGRFVPSELVSRAGELSADEAFAEAMVTSRFDGELLNRPERVIVQRHDGSWHLAWRGRFSRLDGRAGEDLIVDAESGLRLSPRVFLPAENTLRNHLEVGALDLINERVARFYGTASTRGTERLLATLRAAEDLFGIGSAEARAVVASLSSGSKGIKNLADQTKPSVNFSFVSVITTCAGLTCSFETETASTGLATSYFWTFPDGSNSTIPRPTFFFPGYRNDYSVQVFVQFTNGVPAATVTDVDLPEVTPVTPRLGAWFNPDRNGNGIEIFQAANGQLVVFWYTFLPNGTPIWYSTNLSPQNTASWSGALKRSTYNVSNETTSSTTVGSLRLDFSTPMEAWFTWTLDGQSGGERFEYLTGGTGKSGAWFVPSQSGWGVQVEDAGSTLATVVAFFQGSQPRWVIGTGQDSSSNTFIPVRWSTGLGLCPACNGGSTTPPSSVSAGSIRLTIAGSSSTTGTVETNITTPSGSTWNRGPITMNLLTAP